MDGLDSGHFAPYARCDARQARRPLRAKHAAQTWPASFGAVAQIAASVFGEPPVRPKTRVEMKNYMDGGEAILEAFRKLKIDYIMSSPGSEWSPVWEALVRQKIGNHAGPAYIDCWHETLAVNMATGYTLITGRPQAVLVHAGVGLLQGSMGVHGALQSEVPMIVMSGESNTLGEDPDARHRAAMVRRLERRRHRALRREHHQAGAAGDQPVHALRAGDPRRRDGAAHARGPDLSQRRARAHAARLDAAGERPRRAVRAARPGASERSRKSRRPSARGQESDRRRRAIRPRSGGVQGAGRTRRPARLAGDLEPRRQFCQFPDRPSALSRRRQLQVSRGRRSGPARRRPRALVPAARPARPRARSSPSTRTSSKTT